MPPHPRSRLVRKADTIAKLEALEADVWVATASAEGTAHLVPLSYGWNQGRVVLAAVQTSLTVRNIEAGGRARLGFGPTRDVVIMDVSLVGITRVYDAQPELGDAYARQSGWDPRDETDAYVFLVLRPLRVQAWREANELSGRLLMRDGSWLV